MSEKKKSTLLIVDDETDLREAIAIDFERHGYNVLQAANGNAALAIVHATPVDVVISDVRMPDGSGVELLERLKKYNPEVPVVVFITGYMDLSIEDAYDKGADAVFAKPFNRKALHEAVKRITTPLEERWLKRDDRFVVVMEVRLDRWSLPTAAKAQIINVGRGGMFVAYSGPFPKIADFVNFNFNLQNTGIPVTGLGSVRWVREIPSPDLPCGFGMEFVEFENGGRRHFLEYVNSIKTKAFIPKK